MLHNMGNEKKYRKEREIREVDVKDQEWGSDFIADLVKAYGFDFVTFNQPICFNHYWALFFTKRRIGLVFLLKKK